MFEDRVGAQVIQVGHVPSAVFLMLYTGVNGQPDGVGPKVGVVRVRVARLFGFKV